jgi:hypothetical protein
MHRLDCVSCMMKDFVRQVTYVKYMRGLGNLLSRARWRFYHP